MKIAIGSDHRGFTAKEELKAVLSAQGHELIDFGAHTGEPSDYPDFALPAALSVSKGETARAILLCSTGLGMSIAANKVRGIRAALCHEQLEAQIARRHMDTNVLCLPGDLRPSVISQIVDVWLNTPFEGGHHARRVEKITRTEGAIRKNAGGV